METNQTKMEKELKTKPKTFKEKLIEDLRIAEVVARAKQRFK